MNKDSVFFSIHAIGPSSSQRFYFHSNKSDSINLLNYMVDPHSFDDIGSKNYNLINHHDDEIFDTKKGSVPFDKLEPVAKKSFVFTGIVSFDDDLSKKDIYKLYWQDIANIVFQTFIQSQDFNINQWEMQANMHFNTNNKHIQFRIYQNDKTPDNEIFNKKFITRTTLNNIKNNIRDFVDKNIKSTHPVLAYTHTLKGDSIYEYNRKIKQNKSVVEDFVDLLRLPDIDSAENKKKVMKIADLYYTRSWFPNWINTYLNYYDLLPKEKENIRNMIKNNILYEIYNYVQENKYLKVYDFIAKKDPRDKKSQTQKFKNYDKINKEVDFDRLSSYTIQTIKNVYKEPISRFIDMVFANNQYNILELETSIGNYIKDIRPNSKETMEIVPNQTFEHRYSDDFILKFADCVNTPIEEIENSKDKFNPIVDRYYDGLWFEDWINDKLKGYKLSEDQKNKIRKIIKLSILNAFYNSIQNNWDQPLTGFDNTLDTKLNLLETVKKPKGEILKYRTAFEKYIKWLMNSTMFDYYGIEDDINDYLKLIKPDSYKYVIFNPPKDDVSSSSKNK